jgi:hypothetical protein
MRARWSVNLLLSLLVAALGWTMLRDLRVAQEASRLTGMDPTKIEGLELVRPGRDTIKLERITGGGWRMTSPYRIAADSERVMRLLGVTGVGVVRSFPAQGVDLKALGLEPDPVRISLGGQTLRFGTTDPIDRLRYVASGDLVHLTEDRIYHLLTGPAADYVGLSLLPEGGTPAGADINGEPLDPATLAALAGLKAERVEPLGGDLDGRILQVRPSGDAPPLRFLVSPDGLRWSRPDLRLTYLVPSPPPALVEGAPEAAAAAAAPPALEDPATGPFSEQVVGVIEGQPPISAAPAEVAGEADLVPPPTDAAQGWSEPLVDPSAPPEMRVERLDPATQSAGDATFPALPPGANVQIDRQQAIDDAVAASFGGPPVRSQKQIQSEASGADDGEAIVTPEQASQPPPAVKLRPE